MTIEFADLPDVARYYRARTRMVDAGIPIPTEVLRGYLDTIRVARLSETGEFYAKRIIITGDWLSRYPKHAKELFETGIHNGFGIIVPNMPQSDI